MKKFLQFLGVIACLLLGACHYTVKTPSGNEYTVVQQPSVTSSPGLSHLELNGEYVGTWAGGSTVGELAGAAGTAAGGYLSKEDYSYNESMEVNVDASHEHTPTPRPVPPRCRPWYHNPKGPGRHRRPKDD